MMMSVWYWLAHTINNDGIMTKFSMKMNVNDQNAIAAEKDGQNCTHLLIFYAHTHNTSVSPVREKVEKFKWNKIQIDCF